VPRSRLARLLGVSFVFLFAFAAVPGASAQTFDLPSGDLTTRRLLVPGKRTRLNIQSVRLMSRQFQAGSRLVVVLSVIKQPGQQINYGTGKDVSDESIADANSPLKIQWFSDSFLDVPVRR